MFILYYILIENLYKHSGDIKSYIVTIKQLNLLIIVLKKKYHGGGCAALLTRHASLIQPPTIFYPSSVRSFTQNNAIRWGRMGQNNTIRVTGILVSPLLNLSIIIKEQLQNIIDLDSILPMHQTRTDTNASLQFYSWPELHSKQVKNNRIPLYQQLHSIDVQTNLPSHHNYYSIFGNFKGINIQYSTSEHSIQGVFQKVLNETSEKSFFVEDLNVSKVSDIVRNQIEQQL